ncbi:hypothetical protein GCM10007079_42430 [Nocardiopsis terrae]|uniref:Uncharacterized protein n=1 Tax=Nocardiopsis terrae TaxID=372655 RepID=A0ABR9HLL6_9ACTN|nr:hypothetical protein [Nocardiopsis terrae]MBE1459940.1 hypothetical protein [Nocardiopsis terrae]GHC93235.1 hypothetical protein GCM10007079_42430 [Nocardiopsis terrae]
MNAHSHTPDVQVPATGTSTTGIPIVGTPTTGIPNTRTPNTDTPATRVPNRPPVVAASRTDELVSEITGILNHPGRSAHATRTLARADRLFSELDRRIRSGEPLPGAWLAARRPAPPSSRRGIAYEYATQCYDSVSEALREVGGVVVAWRALREAARAWERLDRALIERSPLPEPWLSE